VSTSSLLLFCGTWGQWKMEDVEWVLEPITWALRPEAEAQRWTIVLPELASDMDIGIKFGLA